ncbi:MAG: protein kinase [Deltaproteobacteria bacterium]|nr:protein kinase [Deltaproteobacteria bacterium]
MAVCPNCSTQVADGARFCPSCGSTVPQVPAGEEADPFIGKVIARNFRVESLLGTGGMGRVYKARQISLDKPVVLKVLHPHFNSDPQLVQRFQREARAASRLNHPNSISIIDFGQAEDGTLFMAMELLHGKDLFTLLQEEFPLPEERLARIMVQVCSALAEAHAQNIIHRDLKPENIMVEDRRDQKDFVKVLDFGIAKIQDPSDGDGRALTQQGMVCGTPEYMSPEQARGENLDARSDIYALGVLMYQLVTGDLPFKAETALGIVTKHITERPRSPRQTRPDLPISDEVEGIILKCMEKRADQRFQGATELGQAWKDFLEARQSAARGASSSAHTIRSGTLPQGMGQVSVAAAPAPRAISADPLPKTEASFSVSNPANAVAPPSVVKSSTMVETPARPEAPVPSNGSAAPATPAPLPQRSATDDELDAIKPRRTGLFVGLGAAALAVVAGVGFMATGSGNGTDAKPAPVAVADPPPPPKDPPPPPDKPVQKDPEPAHAKEPVAAKEPTPAAKEPTPAAKEPTPAAKDPAPAKDPVPAAKEPRPAKDPTPAREPPPPADKKAARNPPQKDPEPAAPAGGDDRAEAVREIVKRAEKRMSGGDYDEAIKLLQQARKGAPQEAVPAYLLGNAMLASGDQEGACSSWKDALRLGPKDSRAAGVKKKMGLMCH